MTRRFCFKERAERIRELSSQELDVLILGGGINGAGVLRDLVLRSRTGPPLRLGLIEKEHFAHSASSKNSQLIHGGLRYLKYFAFSLVREALRERAILLEIAPHAVWRQSFLIPIYRFGLRWYYGLGLKLYDVLAGSRNLGKSRWLNRESALREEARLKPEDLKGALLYYDGRMNPSRLVLDQLRESMERGAAAANFVEALNLVRKNGRVAKVRVRDRLENKEFTIRTRCVISTLGAWEKTLPLRLVRGSHLLLPSLLEGRHAVTHFEENGRILFVIPFGPDFQFVLVGTTEKEQHAPEPVEMDAEEEEYLRTHLQTFLRNTERAPTLGRYSALRPLVPDDSNSATKVSRTHRIWKSEENVYHIAGGKWTTFRVMAHELADRVVAENFPDTGPSVTSRTSVDGNTPSGLKELQGKASELAEDFGLSLPTVRLLLQLYGRRAPELMDLCRDPDLAEPILPAESKCLPFVHAQAHWAVENDMNARLEDFLTISTPLGYLHPLDSEARRKLSRHFPVE